MRGLKYFIFASVISADNDAYTEDVKQEIIRRFDAEESSKNGWNNYNWNYILEPLGDSNSISKLIELMTDEKERS